MLTDAQITTLTNHFVRMGMKIGFQEGVGMNICLFRYEDGWGLELVPPRHSRLKEAQSKFKYPENLPTDEMDAAIALAGFVTRKLHNWNTAKKSAAAKDKSQFGNATAARIAKYGQKSHKN